MTKQKKGLLLFLCSLVPGAGEMYMGFFKQGISIMLIFWGTFGLATLSSLSFIVMFLPIMWCYSFFHVHNLKSMSEDDFYAVEDSYLLHLDQFIGNADHFVKKYRKLIAVFLIIFGVSILWPLLLLLLASTCLIQRSRSLTAKRLQKNPGRKNTTGSLIVLISSPGRKQLKLQPLKHKRRNPQNRQLFLRNLLLIHPALRQLLSPQSLLRLLRKLLPEQKRQTDP